MIDPGVAAVQAALGEALQMIWTNTNVSSYRGLHDRLGESLETLARIAARLAAAEAVCEGAEMLPEHLAMRRYYGSADVPAFWTCGCCSEQTDEDAFLAGNIAHYAQCPWLVLQDAVLAYRATAGDGGTDA